MASTKRRLLVPLRPGFDIPNALWKKRVVAEVRRRRLAGTWCLQAGSLDYDDQWLKSEASVASAVLQVPSAILPEEYNILCNLKHTDVLNTDAVQASQSRCAAGNMTPS